MTVAQRMKVAEMARRENEALLCLMRIKTAFSAPVPNEKFLLVNFGEKFFAHRGTKRGTDILLYFLTK